MLKNVRVSSLVLAGVNFVVGGKAFGQAIQAGNVWPNADLSTAAAPGIDQVYNYYNPTAGAGQPYTSGDTNPRPAGWHRGGVDFGTTTTPKMLFYYPTESGSSVPSASPSGYALQISDSDPNNYGEWFSDWNALPAASDNGGVPVHVRFFWAYTGVNSANSGGDSFRVSVLFGDKTGDDTGTTTPPQQIGSNVDDNISIPARGSVPDLAAFTEVDEIINVPVGAYSMRITEDSGGSGQAEGNIWLDDISVVPVPEPMSIATLGAGALCLGARRRRRL